MGTWHNCTFLSSPRIANSMPSKVWNYTVILRRYVRLYNYDCTICDTFITCGSYGWMHMGSWCLHAHRPCTLYDSSTHHDRDFMTCCLVPGPGTCSSHTTDNIMAWHSWVSGSFSRDLRVNIWVPCQSHNHPSIASSFCFTNLSCRLDTVCIRQGRKLDYCFPIQGFHILTQKCQTVIFRLQFAIDEVLYFFVRIDDGVSPHVVRSPTLSSQPWQLLTLLSSTKYKTYQNGSSSSKNII